jgi:hypothetical protein
MFVQLLAVFLLAVPGCANNFRKSPSTPLIGCGPHITSPAPRIKLRDGRHLAYREYGIPKEKAKYKIVVVHGYESSKDETFPASQVIRLSS